VARPGYVFAADNDEIRVVDTLNHLSTDVVIDTSAYGAFPFRGALSPDGKWLYASLRDDGQVLMVDTENLAGPHITVTVGSGPHGIAFSTDGAYAFVANQDSSTVSVIDTIAHTVVTTIPVGVEPYTVASNPCLDKLYVTNQNDDTVSVIDAGTLTVTKVFTAFDEPWDVVFSPSGDRAYVSGDSGGSLAVIDTDTDTVVDFWHLFTDSRFAGLDVSPDGRELYAVNRSNDFGFLVDTATEDVAASLILEDYGWEVAAFPSSAGPYVYMSIKDADQVQVVNADTNSIIGSIPVPGGPRGLALFPPNTFCGASIYLPLVLRNY
jgi:YVTN family beta-propeller protein